MFYLIKENIRYVAVKNKISECLLLFNNLKHTIKDTHTHTQKYIDNYIYFLLSTPQSNLKMAYKQFLSSFMNNICLIIIFIIIISISTKNIIRNYFFCS